MNTAARTLALVTVASILTASACASTNTAPDDGSPSTEAAGRSPPKARVYKRAAGDTGGEAAFGKPVRKHRREHERNEARQRVAEQFATSLKKRVEQLRPDLTGCTDNSLGEEARTGGGTVGVDLAVRTDGTVERVFATARPDFESADLEECIAGVFEQTNVSESENRIVAAIHLEVTGDGPRITDTKLRVLPTDEEAEAFATRFRVFRIRTIVSMWSPKLKACHGERTGKSGIFGTVYVQFEIRPKGTDKAPVAVGIREDNTTLEDSGIRTCVRNTFEQMPWTRVTTEALLKIAYPIQYSPTQ